MSSFYKYFLLFLTASIFGWLVEVIFCIFKNKTFENRSSLIYGPFGFAYGIGALLLTLALKGLSDESIFYIFIISFFVGTIAEYIMSWGMELIFGFVVWDYSKAKFNLNGRVCLLYSVFWGFLGVIWSKYIINIINNTSFFNKTINIKYFSLMAVFLIIDIFITFYAMDRSTRRMKDLEPKNKIDIFFDKHYDDKKLKKYLPQMFDYRGRWL